MRANKKDPQKVIFPDLQSGIFIERVNRFIVKCDLGGKVIMAYLPNPGRMWELLIPGRRLYFVKDRTYEERKTSYTVAAVEKNGIPVMLHTHLTNSVAQWLIEEVRIPGLEGWSVVDREVSIGNSRFDLLLSKDKGKMLLEVKSCTLFGKSIAMFPDAVTLRGSRHIKELSEHSKEGMRAGILFVVHWPNARYFMPEYHTDPTFSLNLYSLRNSLFIKAISIGWEKDLKPSSIIRELEIPWELIERESKDSGSYIVVLYVRRDLSLNIGNIGKIHFNRGYYLYVGSAKANLTKRIERHKRKRKRLFWHIDYLRDKAEFYASLPIRASATLECHIANRLKGIADWSVPRFGSSDCSCGSHLFGMRTDPVKSADFIETLLYFRIDRLEELLKTREEG